MNECKPSAISRLEGVDDTLRELCTAIDIMNMGAEHMANGEYITDVLNHIKKNLQSARAELDEATGTVLRLRATA